MWLFLKRPKTKIKSFNKEYPENNIMCLEAYVPDYIQIIILSDVIASWYTAIHFEAGNLISTEKSISSTRFSSEEIY